MRWPMVFLLLSLLSGIGVPSSAGETDSANRHGPEHAAQMAQGLKLFKSDVRRILVGRCVKCHGGESIESEFDLSTRAGLLAGGDQGPVVELGKGTESRLYRLVAHLEEPYMPEDGAKLDDRQLDAITKWIDLGAPYDQPLVHEQDDPLAWTRRTIDASARQFWSFQPLEYVQPPQADDPWIRTDVDRFIVSKMRENGISPNPPADRRTLIRRAYFDLVGLPPAAAEVQRFVNDTDPRAYEKLIDRLLASPHYGERWGRHWLDVARFAESHGFEQDYDRPYAYHYRDFVIQALNADMPFDQFVRWQLAGDEFQPDNPLAMMATGFLGAGVFPTQLTEKEFEPARYDELDDMVSTTGTAMLGLTIGCARCHDHKFDPIPSADYYRMIATFATTIRSEIEWELDSGTTKVMVTSEGFPPIKHHADGRGFPHFYPQTYFLKRGDTQQKQGAASQGFLQVLTTAPEREEHWQVAPPEGWRTSYRRRALASWITDTPYGAGDLLARVIVNRLWHHHLGRGIVATPNDFGFQGARPTHPELLDWLAGRLIDNGWRLKPLHKQIMTSAVYMQSSDYDQRDARQDPLNQWCWRFAPRRLEAEVIRDTILAVSGQLDPAQFGPGTLDEGMQRRSIYFTVKRSKLIPMMQIFDSPEPLVSVGRRPTTTVAPQALLFMNNPQARACAGSFARLLAPAAEQSLTEAVRSGYISALGRQPTKEELKESTGFLASQIESYAADANSRAQELALADFCQILFSLNEFIYVD